MNITEQKCLISQKNALNFKTFIPKLQSHRNGMKETINSLCLGLEGFSFSLNDDVPSFITEKSR